MEKQNFWIKYKAVICAFALNLLVLLFAFYFYTIGFGTNDDRDISNILANVYAVENSYYITFVNVLLCRFFAVIYDLTGNAVNWYVLVSLVISFLSLTACSYLLLARSKHFFRGICLTVLLLICLFESHYVVFQFTQNAVLYACTGVLFLIDTFIYRESPRWPRFLIGGFFLLFGSMIRFQSVFFLLPGLCLFLFYEIFWGCRKKSVCHFFRENRKSIIALLVCFLLVFGMRGYHNYVFSSDPVLNEYNQANLMRAELLDYGLPFYEENKKAFAEMGLTKADLDLLESQCYLDREVFSNDVLRKMCEMKESQITSYSFRNFHLDAIYTVLLSVWSDLHSSLFWWIICAMGLFFLVGTDRKRLLVLFGLAAATFVLLWYFHSLDRIPYRVWYCVTAPAAVFLAYLCAVSRYGTFKFSTKKTSGSSDRFYQKYLCCIPLVIACVVAIPFCGQRAITHVPEVVTDTYEHIIDFAEERPNEIVLLDRPTISRLTYYSTVGPLVSFSAGSHCNVCIQGGWICWTPANFSTEERFHSSNVFRSIGEGQDVYMIDDSNAGVMKKVSFIRRHYNKAVTAELVQYIDNTTIGVYRVYVDDQRNKI